MQASAQAKAEPPSRRAAEPPSNPDRGRAERAMRAMLGMKKIDAAALYTAADQSQLRPV